MTLSKRKLDVADGFVEYDRAKRVKCSNKRTYCGYNITNSYNALGENSAKDYVVEVYTNTLTPVSFSKSHTNLGYSYKAIGLEVSGQQLADLQGPYLLEIDPRTNEQKDADMEAFFGAMFPHMPDQTQQSETYFLGSLCSLWP